MVVSSVCWDQLRLGSLSPFLIRCNASYFKGTVFGVNPMTWSCLRRPLLTGEWERRWLWLQRGSSHENARRERHEAPATLDGHLLWMCDWSLGVPGVDWLLRAKTANKIICSLVKPLVSLAAFFVSSRNAPLQQDKNSCEGDYKTSTKPIRQWASFQWTSFKIPAVFTDTLLGWWDKINVTWFFEGREQARQVIKSNNWRNAVEFAYSRQQKKTKIANYGCKWSLYMFIYIIYTIYSL